MARQFLLPAPEALLRPLVERGLLTEDEAALARQVPIAEDITVEADSGGHTDNRPLSVLLPVIAQLRDEVVAAQGYAVAPRVGAAGGLGTPASLAAAFACGAAYVVTGSINQCSVESGLSKDGRAMLAVADLADMAMAPAADMFELGVKVQVLKRGTLFANRGMKLHELYRRYGGLDEIPVEERQSLEAHILGRSIDSVWSETKEHFFKTNPQVIERAECEPKHKMALVFRWYLFMASQWARDGVAARRSDYQIWCGPAMGAFNQWVKGSFLEEPGTRQVGQIALNLLEGAATVARAQQLRTMGVEVPEHAFNFRPRPLI